MRNFKIINLFFVVTVLFSFSCTREQKTTTLTTDENLLKKEINDFMNQWHKDAANADTVFFDKMAENAVYIGTDKNELWTRTEFKKWAKPFFERKSAWDFKPTQRNIYFSDDKNYAWFDELLDTWMGVCRSSGVVKRKNNTWEISHYQLSVTIPNDAVKDFIKLVSAFEKK